MTLSSTSHSYTVVAKLQGAGNRQDLLVRDEAGAQRLLLPIEEPTLARDLMPALLAWSRCTSFTDLIEVFTGHGAVYAVFAHRRGRRDGHFLKVLKDAPLPLRAKAVRSLLGGILSQDLPWPILCDVLQEGNLYCSEAGRVTFSYHLAFRPHYDRPCADRAMVLLGELLRKVFAEITLPALDKYLYALETQKIPTIEEAFAAFSSIADEVASAVSALPARPPSLRERSDRARLWAVEKLGGPLAVLLLLSGFTLLGLTLYQQVVAPAPVDNRIRAIGTVVMDEHGKP